MIEIYRPSLRAAGAIAVLFAWLGSLAWLGVRQLGRTEATTLSSEATLRLAPGTVWFALYAGPTQVGNAGISLDTLSPGYQVNESVVLVTRDGAGLARGTRRTETWLGATLNLERLHSRYSRERRRADWAITILGDTVTAHFVSGSSRAQGQSRLLAPPSAVAAVPYRLALGGGLSEGRTRSIDVLDGWPLAAGSATVTVGRDTTLRFVDSTQPGRDGAHLVAAQFDSVRVSPVLLVGPSGGRRLWIDHRGAVSAVETLFGVRWVRTDFDLSETDFRKTLAERTPAILAALPLLTQFAAAPQDTATGIRRFLVQHRDGSAIDPALLELLSSGRQWVRGDTLIVGADPPGGGGETVRDTFPDPMIQEDAGALVALARRLAAEPITRETMPALVARFHQMIRVDTAVTAPDDALGTFAARAGRADGVARLFVALLRDEGISARYVIGVYPRSDGMLTHAWVEVWSQPLGGWYAVDPASGAAIANTGLVRLAFAGSSHPDELMALVANARLVQLAGRETQ